MEKVIRFDDIETQKQKFHQHKEPISIKNIDINKLVLSNKIPYGKKKDLNIWLAKKMLKKLDLYVYFSQRWGHIEKTLMSLNMSFLIKGDELLEKYKDIWEKVKSQLLII